MRSQMEKDGAGVINFLIAGAIGFPAKTICAPDIDAGRRHPEHCSINEPAQTRSTHLKSSITEPSATLCGNEGITFSPIWDILVRKALFQVNGRAIFKQPITRKSMTIILLRSLISAPMGSAKSRLKSRRIPAENGDRLSDCPAMDIVPQINQRFYDQPEKTIEEDFDIHLFVGIVLHPEQRGLRPGHHSAA